VYAECSLAHTTLWYQEELKISDPVIVHVTVKGRWHTNYSGCYSECVSISKTLTQHNAIIKYETWRSQQRTLIKKLKCTYLNRREGAGCNNHKHPQIYIKQLTDEESHIQRGHQKKEAYCYDSEVPKNGP
jgi:hypothetical protein